jgi:hypothetical protein
VSILENGEVLVAWFEVGEARRLLIFVPLSVVLSTVYRPREVQNCGDGRPAQTVSTSRYLGSYSGKASRKAFRRVAGCV